MKQFLALFLLSVVSVVAQPPAPSLVVFLSVDQMRPDYFERYGYLFTGGLHRLYSNGISYTNADLNFATSETGPGHAALGTGCYPSKSGIHSNEWIDPVSMKDVYCVEDSTAKAVEGEGGGLSPRNLKVTAIGDWLKKQSPASKVVSMSTKDRAAILMGGQHPDLVFWYGKKNGSMVTSDYYMNTLPLWVREFNNSDWFERNVPERWTKSFPDSVYLKIGPDEFIAEPKQNGTSAFPHSFSEGKKQEQILGTSYGDQFILDFAMAALSGERLGQRTVTDLLCISLSNCDYVGHGYGPDSHEMLELLVALDRELGKFFSTLDSVVGKSNYVVALSADHAVCPLPEFNAEFKGITGKRYIYADNVKPIIDTISLLLKNKFNTTEDVIFRNSFINYTAAARAGFDSVATEKIIAAELMKIDAYADIYFRRELLGEGNSDRLFIQKYRNSYFAPRGEDYQLRIKENSIISSRTTGTTHGSPYRYDTHVPLLFWWNGVTPQKIEREVHTADAAPSLARFAGFPAPKNLDGVSLPEIKR